MTTPSWMPPLPELPFFRYERHDVRMYIIDYAEQYRRAWMASLKPVTYMNPEWVKGELWPDDCFTLPEQSLPEDWVPLYRLDNSQKDDQP